MATVEVYDRISPAHVQVSHAMLHTLGLQVHRRVALRPCTPSQPPQPPQPPAAVVLHPVGEPGEADADAAGLGQLSPRQLQLLFAAWLHAQSSRRSHSGPISDTMEQVSLDSSSSAEHLPEPSGQAVADLQNGAHAGSTAAPAERAVGLQDGTAMRLEFGSQPGLSAASFFIELRWPPGVPRPPGPVLMQPSHFLQLGVSVELGKAVALPLSTAHPAAPTAGLQKVSAAHEKLLAHPRYHNEDAQVAEQGRMEEGLHQWGGNAQGGKAAMVGFGEKWLAEFVQPAMARLLPLLHHTSRRLLWNADAPPPGGLLVCGPAGSGAWQC